MLDFDVQIEGALTSIDLLAVLVRAYVLSIDFFSCASVVFLASRLHFGIFVHTFR